MASQSQLPTMYFQKFFSLSFEFRNDFDVKHHQNSKKVLGFLKCSTAGKQFSICLDDNVSNIWQEENWANNGLIKNPLKDM